ncbi:MAG: hypothetical protein ACKOHK_00630, partial [Planctomycetia bacterium]
MIQQSWSRVGGGRPLPRWGIVASLVVALAGAGAAAADGDGDAVEQSPRQVPRAIRLVGVDTPGDPGQLSPSAADSPAKSAGPFDAARADLGEDDDLSAAERDRRRGRQRSPERIKKADEMIEKVPDPLQGTPLVSPNATGQEADKIIAKMLRPRSDSWADWTAPLEPLHRCGEPRALPPCVPPPPCHPSMPPAPYDLVGVQGEPSGGPIYGGPCQPRTGTHDDCPHPYLHRLSDRLFDAFY